MAFWRLYYHIVWATKDRHSLIMPQIESDLHRYISQKINDIGCIPHAIGGIENHVHMVVSIPPKMSISEFVKTVKGSSSHFANQRTAFAWQRSYGVFSLGAKQSETAVDYVKNQKSRHKNNDLISWLEISEQPPDEKNK